MQIIFKVIVITGSWEGNCGAIGERKIRCKNHGDGHYLGKLSLLGNVQHLRVATVVNTFSGTDTFQGYQISVKQLSP